MQRTTNSRKLKLLICVYLDLSRYAINRDMQYPITPGPTKMPTGHSKMYVNQAPQEGIKLFFIACKASIFDKHHMRP